MALRCGYMIKKGKIIREIIDVPMDLGWDEKSKVEYVKNTIETMSNLHPASRIEDVSAHSRWWSRDFSPYCMRFDNGHNFETQWRLLYHEFTDRIEYDDFVWTKPITDIPFLHFYCFYGNYLVNKIRQVDIFVDTFYNPENEEDTTPAKACAILKLLDKHDHLDALYDITEFLEWCNMYIVE